MARLTDNFSGYTPGVVIVGQGTWVHARETYGGVYGVYVDNSTGVNHVIQNNSRAICAVQSSEQFNADQFAEITFGAVSFSGYVSLLLRGSGIGSETTDILNGFLIQFNNNELYIEVYINNDVVQSACYALNRSFAAGDTFRAEIEGTTLRVYHNDTQITTVGSSGNISLASYISSYPVLASGNVGFGFSYGDNSRISQFYGGDLTEDTADEIEGETSGVASVVGTLRGIRNGVGAAAGVSTVSGTLTGVVHATALSEGISSVTGSVIGLVGITGAIDGESTVTGSLSSPMMIEGGSDGQASVEAELAGQGSLMTISDGTSDVTASITGRADLAAVASGQAIVTGDLRAETDVGGISRGEAAVAGTLSATGGLAAIVSGSAVTRANLSEWMPDAIQGTTQGVSTVNGQLSAHGRLLAASDGVALAGGSLGGRIDLTGNAVGISQVSGIVSGDGWLLGESTGRSVVTAWLDKTGTFQAEGMSSGRSAVTGWLSIVGVYPEIIEGMSRITTQITGMSRITENISGGSRITEEIQGVSKIL